MWLPADWVWRVLRAESAGHTRLDGRPITSSAGAMGLMQLMPATWMAMRARLRLGDDPYDPHDNILAGAVFLRMMYDRFGYPGLFGAYNAGPGRYRAHLSGAPLPGETRAYLAKLTAGDARLMADARAPEPGLFVTNRARPDLAQGGQSGSQSLFAVRRDGAGGGACERPGRTTGMTPGDVCASE